MTTIDERIYQNLVANESADCQIFERLPAKVTLRQHECHSLGTNGWRKALPRA